MHTSFKANVENKIRGIKLVRRGHEHGGTDNGNGREEGGME